MKQAYKPHSAAEDTRAHGTGKSQPRLPSLLCCLSSGFIFNQQRVRGISSPVVTSIIVRTSKKILQASFGAQKTLELPPFYSIIYVWAASPSTEPQMPYAIMDIFPKLKNWNTFLTISHYFELRDILQNAIWMQQCCNPQNTSTRTDIFGMKLSQ